MELIYGEILRLYILPIKCHLPFWPCKMLFFPQSLIGIKSGIQPFLDVTSKIPSTSYIIEIVHVEDLCQIILLPYCGLL